MPTHSHTQAVLNHYQKALIFCPQTAKIQERIAGLHWTIWDIPQAREQIIVIRSEDLFQNPPGVGGQCPPNQSVGWAMPTKSERRVGNAHQIRGNAHQIRVVDQIGYCGRCPPYSPT